MSRKLTTEEFIERAIKIHGDLYSYEFVEYTGNKSKVKIWCKKDKIIFEQLPGNHLKGSRCPICFGTKKSNTEEFVEKAKKVHGNRYSYEFVEYTNKQSKIKIVCKKHGIFEQMAYAHLKGQNCSKCDDESRRITLSDFIRRSKEKHGDLYEYDDVKYTNNSTKVSIYCKKCQKIFKMAPNHHLRGEGCPICFGTKKYTNESFIQKARDMYGDRYDYSLVNYIQSHIKVDIICKKHGIFRVKPNNHLNDHHCPKCYGSVSRQEIELANFIKSVYPRKIVTNTRKVIKPYELDIYLPDINKAFEYNGTYWHEEGINKPVGYHQMKTDRCASKGITLHHVWEKDWINDNRFMRECIRREIS